MTIYKNYDYKRFFPDGYAQPETSRIDDSLGYSEASHQMIRQSFNTRLQMAKKQTQVLTQQFKDSLENQKQAAENTIATNVSNAMSGLVGKIQI